MTRAAHRTSRWRDRAHRFAAGLSLPRDSFAFDLSEIPLEDLIPGPAHNAGTGLNVLQRFFEEVKAMGGSHEIRMEDQRHDSRRLACIGIQLLKLVDRTILVFRCFVVLNGDYRNIIEFYCIWDANELAGARFEHHRLVVQNPIANVFVAFFSKDVGCLPRLGQTGTEPSARPTAGECTNHFRRFGDVGSLVGDLLHVLLSESMTDEFPFALERRACDRLVRTNDTTLDGQPSPEPEAVQHFEHPPETDAVSIFMPCPIWDVGHRRTTGRRREDRPRHGVTRIPFLDIHDYPHHQASTAWQHEPRPVFYRRIRKTLGREHRHISFQPAENITNRLTFLTASFRLRPI